MNKFTKNATDIINNSDIYEYNLKSDADEDKKLIGFIIGENYKTPIEVISKEGQENSVLIPNNLANSEKSYNLANIALAPALESE